MKARQYAQFKKNTDACFDSVLDDCEVLVVTRSNSRNVVVLSESVYDNILENMFILGNKANYDWLMESKKQYESAQLIHR